MISDSPGKIRLSPGLQTLIRDFKTVLSSSDDLKTVGGAKITLAGMTELSVETAADIDDIIKLGEKNRTVASTKMNSQRCTNDSMHRIVPSQHLRFVLAFTRAVD